MLWSTFDISLSSCFLSSVKVTLLNMNCIVKKSLCEHVKSVMVRCNGFIIEKNVNVRAYD